MYIDLLQEARTNSEFQSKLYKLTSEITRREARAEDGEIHISDASDIIVDIYRLCNYNAGFLVPYFFPAYPYDAPLSCQSRPYSFAMYHFQIGGSTTFRASRQVGKSTGLIGRQLIHSHIIPKFKSLFITPHQHFLDTYANRMREMERAFRFYNRDKNFRQNLKFKEYPNGSQVYLVKCLTDSQEARSKSADENLFDESVTTYTLVHTFNGLTTEQKYISDLLGTSHVLGYDEYGNISPTRIKAIYNKGKKHVYTLKFSNGDQLTCTGNTRFYTSRGWMFACEFMSWDLAAKSETAYKAKTLLAIREAATPGDSSWRRQHIMDQEIKTIQKGAFSIQQENTTNLLLDSIDIAILKFFILDNSKEDTNTLQPIYLTSIEYAGIEEVWDIETESKTFFANGIAIHNCQLLDPELLPDIEQTQKASQMPCTVYAGTATTVDSLLETKFQNSSKGTWLVPAPHYTSKTVGKGWLNMNDVDDVLACINVVGPINPATGKILEVEKGHFVHEEQEAFLMGRIGFHIPQIIIPEYAFDPIKWMEIWDDYLEYPRAKFLHEVLGIPTEEGHREITMGDLKAMCVLDLDPRNREAVAIRSRQDYVFVISGCDWGGSDYNPADRTKVSYTVHVMLGITNTGDIHIIHMRQYSGMDYRSIIDDITKDHVAFNGMAIACDFGVGAAYNMLLREHPKISPERHFIFNYVGPNSAPLRAPQAGPGWFNQFSLNRTESISTLFNAIKDGEIKCYAWQHAEARLMELLNMYRIPSETPGGAQAFRYKRHGAKADDTLHALNFAYVLVRLYRGEPIVEDKALKLRLQQMLQGGKGRINFGIGDLGDPYSG